MAIRDAIMAVVGCLIRCCWYCRTLFYVITAHRRMALRRDGEEGHVGYVTVGYGSPHNVTMVAPNVISITWRLVWFTPLQVQWHHGQHHS